jgi:hypothetical protein
VHWHYPGLFLAANTLNDMTAGIHGALNPGHHPDVAIIKMHAHLEVLHCSIVGQQESMRHLILGIILMLPSSRRMLILRFCIVPLLSLSPSQV